MPEELRVRTLKEVKEYVKKKYPHDGGQWADKRKARIILQLNSDRFSYWQIMSDHEESVINKNKQKAKELMEIIKAVPEDDSRAIKSVRELKNNENDDYTHSQRAARYRARHEVLRALFRCLETCFQENNFKKVLRVSKKINWDNLIIQEGDGIIEDIKNLIRGEFDETGRILAGIDEMNEAYKEHIGLQKMADRRIAQDVNSDQSRIRQIKKQEFKDEVITPFDGVVGVDNDDKHDNPSNNKK